MPTLRKAVTFLSQDVVRRNLHVRETERCDRVSAGDCPDARIFAARRVAVYLDHVCGEMYQPGLRNPGARVEWQVGVAVVGERGIGDLDDGQDVFGARVVRGSVGRGLKRRHGGLRRGALPGHDGVMVVEYSDV